MSVQVRDAEFPNATMHASILASLMAGGAKGGWL